MRPALFMLVYKDLVLRMQDDRFEFPMVTLINHLKRKKYK
jgi:hypothetical protein